MSEGDQPASEPKIMIDPAQMAGVWANFARVSHSPYEFTLDFVRLDYATNHKPSAGHCCGSGFVVTVDG